MQSHCSGEGPFSTRVKYTFEEFLAIKEEYEKEQIAKVTTKHAKKSLARQRRQAFNTIRAQLSLQLIEAGQPYSCAHPGCEEHENLTIDHIMPLSKGGSDAIENLQFMCLRHNSSKGDSLM